MKLGEGATIINQRSTNPTMLFWSHDPYNRRRPVSTRIGQAGYGFGPYNLRPFKWPVLGLTVRCRHPYKPGRTPVKYGTARSPSVRHTGWARDGQPRALRFVFFSFLSFTVPFRFVFFSFRLFSFIFLFFFADHFPLSFWDRVLGPSASFRRGTRP